MCFASFFIIGPAFYILKNEIPWEDRYYSLEEAEEFYFSSFVTKLEINTISYFDHGIQRSFPLLRVNSIIKKVPNIRKIKILNSHNLISQEISKLQNFSKLREVLLPFTTRMKNFNLDANDLAVNNSFFQEFDNLKNIQVYFQELLFRKNIHECHQKKILCKDQEPSLDEEAFSKKNYSNITYIYKYK